MAEKCSMYSDLRLSGMPVHLVTHKLVRSPRQLNYVSSAVISCVPSFKSSGNIRRQGRKLRSGDIEAAEWVSRGINDPMVEVDPVTVLQQILAERSNAELVRRSTSLLEGTAPPPVSIPPPDNPARAAGFALIVTAVTAVALALRTQWSKDGSNSHPKIAESGEKLESCVCNAVAGSIDRGVDAVAGSIDRGVDAVAGSIDGIVRENSDGVFPANGSCSETLGTVDLLTWTDVSNGATMTEWRCSSDDSTETVINPSSSDESMVTRSEEATTHVRVPFAGGIEPGTSILIAHDSRLSLSLEERVLPQPQGSLSLKDAELNCESDKNWLVGHCKYDPITLPPSLFVEVEAREQSAPDLSFGEYARLATKVQGDTSPQCGAQLFTNIISEGGVGISISSSFNPEMPSHSRLLMQDWSGGFSDSFLVEGEIGNHVTVEKLSAAANRKMEEDMRASFRSTVKAMLPALAVGGGAGGVIAGVDGALEMVGMIASVGFISHELLWASKRQQLWKELSQISDHSKLLAFLRARDIVREC